MVLRLVVVSETEVAFVLVAGSRGVHQGIGSGIPGLETSAGQTPGLCIETQAIVLGHWIEMENYSDRFAALQTEAPTLAPGTPGVQLQPEPCAVMDLNSNKIKTRTKVAPSILIGKIVPYFLVFTSVCSAGQTQRTTTPVVGQWLLETSRFVSENWKLRL